MKKTGDMKALARETLLGKYKTVIGACLLSGITVFLSGLPALFCILAAFANTERFEPAVRKLIPSFQKSPALSVIFAVLFTAFSLLTFILACFMRIGRQKLLLNICRGEKYGCSDIFYAFRRGSHPWRIIGVDIVTLMFVNAAYIIPAVLSLAARACGHDQREPVLSDPWGIAVFAVNILALLLSFWLSLGFAFAATVIIDRPEARIMEALKASLRITKHRKLKLCWLISVSFIFWYLLVWTVKIASLWVLPYIEATVIIFYLCARGEEFAIPANRPKTVPSAEPAEKAEASEEEVPAEEAAPEAEKDVLSEEVTAEESFTEELPEEEETIIIDEEPVPEKTAEIPELSSVTEASEEKTTEEIPKIYGEEIIITEDEV